MNEDAPQPEPAVGLRRFHKITIGAAIVFLLLLGYRYLRLYLKFEEGVHAAYGMVALAGALGLFLYLRAFSRSGGFG